MDIVILELSYGSTHLSIQTMIIIFNDVEIPLAPTLVMNVLEKIFI